MRVALFSYLPPAPQRGRDTLRHIRQGECSVLGQQLVVDALGGVVADLTLVFPRTRVMVMSDLLDRDDPLFYR